MNEPVRLYASRDIAEACGVTPAAVTNWRTRGKPIPEPAFVLVRSHRNLRDVPLWTEEQFAEIMAWHASRVSGSAEILRARGEALIAQAEAVENGELSFYPLPRERLTNKSDSDTLSTTSHSKGEGDEDVHA